MATVNPVEAEQKRLLKDLLHLDLKESKKAFLSTVPFSLKRVGEELWSCHEDGIHVYSGELELQRTIRNEDNPWVYSVALMPDGTVAVAGYAQLYLIDQSGEFQNTLADEQYYDLALHDGVLFATALRTPDLHAYDIGTGAKLTSYQVPCGDSPHLLCHHRVVVINSRRLMLSCSFVKKIYTVNSRNGKLQSEHGREINISDAASSEDDSEQRENTATLRTPYICQEDAEGAVLVADTTSHRLLVLREGRWCQLRVPQELTGPNGAVWFRGRLYIGTDRDRLIVLLQ